MNKLAHDLLYALFCVYLFIYSPVSPFFFLFLFDSTKFGNDFDCAVYAKTHKCSKYHYINVSNKK